MRRRRTENSPLRWVAIAVLFATPITVRAVPLSEYQERVHRAVTALYTLVQSDEEETRAQYESRLDQTFAAVRDLLPEHESVEASADVCHVDNSWLHAGLKETREAPSPQQAAKLGHLIERLTAIEERIGYGQRPAVAGEGKTERRQKLESILARPEYATGARGPNALTRLIQDFLRWLEQFLPKPVRGGSGGASWVGFVAQIAVVIVALLVLLYVVKILLTRFRRAREKRPPKKRKARVVLGERLEPEDTATDLLSEAEALARRGDLRGAIRKAYIALLVELGDRKLLTLAQHKTNRDYLNAVRNIPLLHSRMRALTESFERHWYGFVDATDGDWQSFRSRYRAALQTES